MGGAGHPPWTEAPWNKSEKKRNVEAAKAGGLDRLFSESCSEANRRYNIKLGSTSVCGKCQGRKFEKIQNLYVEELDNYLNIYNFPVLEKINLCVNNIRTYMERVGSNGVKDDLYVVPSNLSFLR